MKLEHLLMAVILALAIPSALTAFTTYLSAMASKGALPNASDSTFYSYFNQIVAFINKNAVALAVISVLAIVVYIKYRAL
jgi:hypothetical protein